MKKQSFFDRFFRSEHKAGNIAVAFLVVMLLTIAFIWPGNSLLKGISAMISTARTQKQTEKYLEQTAILNERIKNIKTNSDTLEKIGRENFGLAKPGDEVYIVE